MLSRQLKSCVHIIANRGKRMRKRVAIITARGGSKRIPKKNIRDFCGKPILVYSIEAALASALFDEVMVSTDSEEIAEIARAAGAKVPFMRSAETANDYASTTDVLLEVLGKPASFHAGSTDCNIPLSLGIPAICVGVYVGGGAHTREEWVQKRSIVLGFEVGLKTMLRFTEGK